jgi:hypothetical protein
MQLPHPKIADFAMLLRCVNLSFHIEIDEAGILITNFRLMHICLQ